MAMEGIGAPVLSKGTATEGKGAPTERVRPYGYSKGSFLTQKMGRLGKGGCYKIAQQKTEQNTEIKPSFSIIHMHVHVYI